MTKKQDSDAQVAPAVQGSFMPQMSPEQFTQLMQTVIAEAKKPYGEDELKAKMEKLREQMRADVAEYNEEVKQRQLRCGHLRVDDGKTTIAWQTYLSEKLPRGGVRYGVCMRCQRDFYPIHDDYYKWIAMPSSTVEMA